MLCIVDNIKIKRERKNLNNCLSCRKFCFEIEKMRYKNLDDDDVFKCLSGCGYLAIGHSLYTVPCEHKGEGLFGSLSNGGPVIGHMGSFL